MSDGIQSTHRLPGMSTVGSVSGNVLCHTCLMVYKLRCIKDWDRVEKTRVWSVKEGAWPTELQTTLSSVASQLIEFERERL